MNKLLFQSSLPRSGSTLLQNILAQNPDFYATPTSPLADYVAVMREVYTNNPNVNAQDEEQMKSAFKHLCKKGMEGYFEALTDKKYIIDKSRMWMPNFDFLTFVMDKEPKMICTVRDLRDVFASNEKNFRKNPHKSRAAFGMGEANTLPKRIDVWAASTNFTGNAIDSLNDALRIGLEDKILFVKYENLCLYPEKTMNRVYNYLDIPTYNHDFNHVPQATHEDDKIHGIFGIHDIRNTVELLPSDAKQILGNDVCDWIYNNYKWFFDYFGYNY